GGNDRHPNPERARLGLGLFCFDLLNSEMRHGTATWVVSDGSHDGPTGWFGGPQKSGAHVVNGGHSVVRISQAIHGSNGVLSPRNGFDFHFTFVFDIEHLASLKQRQRVVRVW